jgi:hypothetical protein
MLQHNLAGSTTPVLDPGLIGVAGGRDSIFEYFLVFRSRLPHQYNTTIATTVLTSQGQAPPPPPQKQISRPLANDTACRTAVENFSKSLNYNYNHVCMYVVCVYNATS